MRALVLESKRVTLSVTALHAVSYLLAPVPTLPVADDARALERMRALHAVSLRGARRDIRRYRLALWVLGQSQPAWLQVLS
jgi:hypothetical protein